MLKKKQKSDWSENQEDFAKIFVNHLVTLLWYIDPHHSTLAAYLLNISNTFKELNLYQYDEYYNSFYFIRHYKKELLKKEKLKHLT